MLVRFILTFSLLVASLSGFSQMNSSVILNKSFPSLTFLYQDGKNVYSVSERTSYSYVYRTSSKTLQIVTSPITKEEAAGVSKATSVILPQLGGKDAILVHKGCFDNKLLVLCGYKMSESDYRIRVVLFSMKGELIFDRLLMNLNAGTSLTGASFVISKHKNDFLVAYRHGKQLLSRRLIEKSGEYELSELKRTFVPHIGKSMKIINMGNSRFFIGTFSNGELRIVAIENGEVKKTELVDSETNYIIYYEWKKSGDDLYVLGYNSTYGIKGITGLGIHRISFDKEVKSNFHVFTSSEYEKMDGVIKEKTNNYNSLTSSLREKDVYVLDDEICATATQIYNYIGEQTYFFTFDKESLEYKKTDVLYRKMRFKLSSARFQYIQLYQSGNKLKGYYFDYPQNLEVNSYEKFKKMKGVLTKNKKGSQIELTYDQKITKSDKGKKKFLMNMNTFVERENYVAFYCSKGGKGFWKIVSK